MTLSKLAMWDGDDVHNDDLDGHDDDDVDDDDDEGDIMVMNMT